MSAGAFLGGLAFLALVAGSSLAFGYVVVHRRFDHLTGAPRLLAVGLLASLGLVAAHLVPGALGVLGRPAVAVTPLALFAGAVLLPAAPPAGADNRRPPPAPPSSRASWVLAGAAIGLLALYVLAYAVDDGGIATRHVDMTTFHLPNVARWIQGGSFWQIDDFVPHRAFGYYPNNADVVTLAAVLPFDNDFLVRFVNYPFLAMAGLAAYALGRELGGPAASSALFAAGFAAMPVVALIALEGLADTVMLATFGAGLVFLLRQLRTGAGSDLVLAGIGLGLSLGTKWYAVPAVAIALAGWAVAALAAKEGPGVVLRRLAGLGALVLAVGGFWLLRNLVEAGNPLFPVELDVLGVTVFDAPRDVHRELVGFSLADYIDDPGLWEGLFWGDFLAFMSWFAVLLWAALALGAVLALRRSATVLLCVAVAAGIGVAYLFIPYGAQGPAGEPVQAWVNARYVVPALLLGAGVAAWATGRLGRGRLALEALALLFVLDALRRNLHVGADALAAGALALAVLAGAAWLVRARRVPGPALAGLAAVAAVGLLYAQEQRFNDGRYDEAEPTAHWIDDNAPEDRRVGVVGEGFVVYPMFGPRLGNEVEYVGPREDGMLRTYRDRGRFDAAIEEGGYDLVLVQRAGFIDPGLPERQERWIRELGYEQVAEGNQFPAGAQTVGLYRRPPHLSSARR